MNIKMQILTITTLALVLEASKVIAWPSETTGAPSLSLPPPSSTSSNTDTCASITTSWQGCPSLSCTVLDCAEIVSVTLSCGCAFIRTASSCATACPTSCGGTIYSTVTQHCGPTSTSSPTTSSSPISPPPQSTTTVPPVSSTPSTGYNNSTITTTTIITVTTCPITATCTGQTTTWTSTLGPFSCTASPTCTCVLPGSPTETVTGGGTGSPPKTGPAPSSSPTFIEANGGMKLGADALVSVLIAALLGFL